MDKGGEADLPEEIRAMLAERIRQAAAGECLVHIPRRSDDSTAPASFAQQRLWFIDRFQDGASTQYNIPFRWRVRGAVDAGALERAVRHIVERHEVLRTTVREDESGHPTQRVRPPDDVPFILVDLRHIASNESREARAREIAREDARTPFDLSTGPVCRFHLLRLAEDDHVLLCTFHHVAFDGWSSGVFLHELGMCYRAYLEGHEPRLPALDVQYADYAAWQREWLQGDVLERQLAYWREKLADTPILELPLDHSRPVKRTHRGARHALMISSEVAKRLRDLAREEGASLFMPLLAGFQTVLAKYSGQEDFAVGSPVAGRNHEQLERLIGFFVNTLVLRTDLSGSPTFRELVARVKATCVEAYDHQDVPFEHLVAELDPSRDLQHDPFFQVSFVFQNVPNAAVDADAAAAVAAASSGNALRLDDFPDAMHPMSKFDLSLSMQETGEGLAGRLVYNADLFEPATIERFAWHFSTVLEEMARAPDRRVGDVDVLTREERERVLREWSGTTAPLAREGTLHDLFHAQARAHPERVAVTCGAARLSYAELETRANRLAHHLRWLGAGAGTLVAVALERSVDLVVAILGVLKSGAAYVPIDPEHPEERVRLVLEDTRAPIVVTQRALRAAVPASASLHLVVLDDPELIARVGALPATPPAHDATPDALAYVMYTSGSTGRPKGVMVPHRGVVNLAHGLEVVYGARTAAEGPLRVSLNAPVTFDASVKQFVALLHGHTLRVVEAEERRDPGALVANVGAAPVDVLDCTPTHLRALLAAGLFERAGAPRHVLVGGEAIDGDLWRRIAALPGVRFYNVYGPTECTVDATLHVVDASTPPILGRPLPNVRVYVLDKHRRPVPVGVSGELYIGGAGVAHGYLGRPDLTAERFLPDPFAEEAGAQGARMYRTGDRVRWRADGSLEFLGRADDQVKVRGYRIEPAEIEHALAAHDEVRHALVTAHATPSGDKQLVAYYTTAASTPSPAAELRDHVAARLPAYMVPHHFVHLEAFPLTPNGKVYRKALPAPHAAPAEETYEPPATPAEAALAEVWQQVLGLARVGVHDHFFEVGGDSILSIQVAARARQRGVHVTPRDLFEHPTVRGLARVAGTAPTVQAEQGPVSGPAPLTPIQARFLWHDWDDLHHFNQSMLLAAPDAVDAHTLQRALDALAAHHDMLRARFRRSRGSTEWAQRVEPPGGKHFVLATRDLVGEPDPMRAMQAHASALQAALDFEEGPVARAAVYRLGAERGGTRVLLVAHHLVVDGVSWRVLVEDLNAAYAQLARGDEVRLPPKTTSYREWASRLHESIMAGELDAEAAKWLADETEDLLPIDREGENTEESVRAVQVALSPEATARLLQEAPRAYRTRVNDLLLTALVQAHREWTGRNALRVHLESHGREDAFSDVDLSRTVGWFTTMYPVTLRLPDANDTGACIKAVKEQLRAVPRNGFAYHAVRHLGRSETAERLRALPTPQVLFNYLGQFDQEAHGDHASAFTRTSGPRGRQSGLQGLRDHVLEVNGATRKGSLSFTFTYSVNLHEDATLRRFADLFLQRLEGVVEHCVTPGNKGLTPSDFPLAKLRQNELDALMRRLRP